MDGSSLPSLQGRRAGGRSCLIFQKTKILLPLLICGYPAGIKHGAFAGGTGVPMTKEQILEYLTTNQAQLDMRTVLMTMLGAFLIGLIICLVYRFVFRGAAYNRDFTLSILVILLIAAAIMLMISSNIVLSLGTVGALSIVRFRTAIKDSRDTVFLFWAIAEGLCTGSGNMRLALVTTAVIAIVFLLSSLLSFSSRRYVLVVRGGEEIIDSMEVGRVLKSYVSVSNLRSVSRTSDHQELIYEIRAKKPLTPRLTEAVSEVQGVTAVNWVAETGDTLG